MQCMRTTCQAGNEGAGKALPGSLGLFSAGTGKKLTLAASWESLAGFPGAADFFVACLYGVFRL